MAEKEEFIVLRKIKNPCAECRVKKCNRKCIFGLMFEKDKFKKSRTTIKNRIARALFELNAPMSWVYKNAPSGLIQHYKKQAEYILNEILRGTK